MFRIFRVWINGVQLYILFSSYQAYRCLHNSLNTHTQCSNSLNTYIHNGNTFSNEFSGGKFAGIGGWALIGVDTSVEDDTSTT